MVSLGMVTSGSTRVGRMLMRSIVLSVALANFCWLGPFCLAHAQKVPATKTNETATKVRKRRIYVESFNGPLGGQLEQVVRTELKKDPSNELISKEKLSRFRKELSKKSLSASEQAEFARRYAIAAFVTGQLSKQRREYVGHIEVHSGADSSITGSETWRSKHIDGALGEGRDRTKRLGLALMSAKAPPLELQYAGAQDDASMVDDTTPEELLNASGSTLIKEDLLHRDEIADDAYDLVDGESINVMFLAGVVNRTFQPQLEVYTRTRTTGDPSTVIREQRDYANPGVGVPELGLQAEIYPGKWLNLKALRYVGGVISYRHSVFTKSTGCAMRANYADPCPVDQKKDIGTSESEFFLGVKGRFNLGESKNRLLLSPQIGYGFYDFSFNVDDLKGTDFPSVIPPLFYEYLQIGMGVRYEVIHRYFWLGANFAYRMGLGLFQSSPDGNAIWGDQTDPATGIKLGIDMTSDAPYLFRGAYWYLGVDWFRFTTNFRGQSACVGPNNCSGYDDQNNPNHWEIFPQQTGSQGQIIGGPVDPTTDIYIRVQLGLGWRFQ